MPFFFSQKGHRNWLLMGHNNIVWYTWKLCGIFIFPLSIMVWFGFMVLNATFNNISVISGRSVLLMEENRVSGQNHRPVASY